MKYRVIGWTDYDNDLFSDEEISDAAMYAIVDDIRKNGYYFSGFDHQERLYGAPVLNDGKRRTFSQRGFGAVMAMAYDTEGDYAYSLYAFAVKPDRCVMPTIEAVVGYKPEENLAEEFEISLAVGEYEAALADGTIETEDIPSLRMIDKGDALIISCGEECHRHKVRWAERTKVDGSLVLKIGIEV